MPPWWVFCAARQARPDPRSALDHRRQPHLDPPADPYRSAPRGRLCRLEIWIEPAAKVGKVLLVVSVLAGFGWLGLRIWNKRVDSH
jgi:hypothetical protein